MSAGDVDLPPGGEILTALDRALAASADLQEENTERRRERYDEAMDDLTDAILDRCEDEPAA